MVGVWSSKGLLVSGEPTSEIGEYDGATGDSESSVGVVGGSLKSIPELSKLISSRDDGSSTVICCGLTAGTAKLARICKGNSVLVLIYNFNYHIYFILRILYVYMHTSSWTGSCF